MSGLVELSEALMAWERFLDVYRVVEPGTAFDLRGDPPHFIHDLRQRIGAHTPKAPA